MRDIGILGAGFRAGLSHEVSRRLVSKTTIPTVQFAVNGCCARTAGNVVDPFQGRYRRIAIAFLGDANRRPWVQYNRIMNETATIGIDTELAEETLVSRVPVIRETTAFWLKGCTRCGGDLVSASDMEETYPQCRQCGFYPSDSDGISPS